MYQDEQLVAIDKPCGLQVHRSRISEETTHFALQQLRDQLQQKVFLVHRLDRPTSGVLLFALNAEMHQQLRQQFDEKTVQKTYLAIVRGHTPESGRIDKPLVKLETKKIQSPQAATTDYIRLATVEKPYAISRYPTARYSLVKIHPLTGRMHQIRRHFAHLRHYIVGDKKHGERHHNRYFKEELNCTTMFLHAQKLQFTHPISQKPITLSAYPHHWNPILSELGWTGEWENVRI